MKYEISTDMWDDYPKCAQHVRSLILNSLVF